MTLLRLLEALWGRPNIHRLVAEEHLRVPLEVAHLKLSQLDLGLFTVIIKLDEDIV